MYITRAKADGFYPPAIDVLASEFQASLFNTAYDKRHPLGVYNVSLSRITNAFKNVLESLDKFIIKADPEHPTTFDAQDLLMHQTELLHALFSHFDDCRSVLKCFYEPSIGRDKRKFDKQSPVASFDKNTTWYRDHIARISNHIKHHQGRLSAICIFANDLVMPGYFVEGVIPGNSPSEPDALGPYPDIHKPFKDMKTAFSFARDLKYHFFAIYALSFHLRNSLISMIGNHKSFTTSIRSEDFETLAERLESMPNRFFNDEIYKPVPAVRTLRNDTAIEEIRLVFPDPITVFVLPKGKLAVWSSFMGDGVSKTFQLPYFA